MGYARYASLMSTLQYKALGRKSAAASETLEKVSWRNVIPEFTEESIGRELSLMSRIPCSPLRIEPIAETPCAKDNDLHEVPL